MYTVGLSNPPEVYQFVLNLQVQWRSLATHLGYTEREIGSILRAGGNDYRMQIRLFLRVWWMPDCGEGKTVTILQRGMYMYLYMYMITLDIYMQFFIVQIVIQEKMKASPRPLQVKVSLLHVYTSLRTCILVHVAGVYDCGSDLHVHVFTHSLTP